MALAPKGSCPQELLRAWQYSLDRGMAAPGAPTLHQRADGRTETAFPREVSRQEASPSSPSQLQFATWDIPEAHNSWAPFCSALSSR